MTQSFSTDSNNDIFLNNDGNLAVASKIDAVLFACANAAKAQLNEMIYAYDKGVANFPTIWTSAINVAQFEASVRGEILNVPGVTGISSFDMLVVDSAMNYRAVIETIYGTGVIGEL